MVLGELLVGLGSGPSVLGLFNLPYFESAHVSEAIREFGELGVIFLMFTAGLEVAVDDLRKAGRPAVWSGVWEILSPLVLRVGAGPVRSASILSARSSSALSWRRRRSASGPVDGESDVSQTPKA